MALSVVLLAAPLPAALLGAVDLALVACIAVDLVLTPSPRRFAIERELPVRVGLDHSFERRITLTAPGSTPRTVRVHEEFPAPCAVLARSVDGAMGAPAAGPAGGDTSGGVGRGRLGGAGRCRGAKRKAGDAALAGLFMA